MKGFEFKTQHKKLLGDVHTPVSMYLKLRDRFAGSILLESSDYHGVENSLSYICCDPVASFKVKDCQVSALFPDGTNWEYQNEKPENILGHLQAFTGRFKGEQVFPKIANNGLFGFLAYEAVQYFEDIPLKKINSALPEICYHVYRFVIVFDHFHNEIYLFENHCGDEKGLVEIEAALRHGAAPAYPFQTEGGEHTNIENDAFLEILEKGIHHCKVGDVFQIVLSRKFSQAFKGDEFNVYRVLRAINPSPYLFYFDHGKYKLFGSSPEAQLVIEDGKACIFPIAGTFRRTGNDKADEALAVQLSQDVKENSEHVMLVDLARNDLSRNGREVTVEVFKEVQFYSHVIHLVSKVVGTMKPDANPLRLVADTFPAGTLSGAPKYRAMQLINEYEHDPRGYYGGALGYMSFEGNFNHAIMIRSFHSEGNVLTYQAGAGIVAKSNAESELQEVNNKLAALRQALKEATKIFGKDKIAAS